MDSSWRSIWYLVAISYSFLVGQLKSRREIFSNYFLAAIAFFSFSLSSAASFFFPAISYSLTMSFPFVSMNLPSSSISIGTCQYKKNNSNIIIAYMIIRDHYDYRAILKREKNVYCCVRIYFIREFIIKVFVVLILVKHFPEILSIFILLFERLSILVVARLLHNILTL